MSKHGLAKYIQVNANVRYWEDATVNGVEDVDGTLIPHRRGEAWCPTIRLADGVVTDWPSGVTAKIYYKVCDDGVYRLLNASGGLVAELDGYVPDCLAVGESGYGDYIILTIDGAGRIAGWKEPALDDDDWEFVG